MLNPWSPSNMLLGAYIRSRITPNAPHTPPKKKKMPEKKMSAVSCCNILLSLIACCWKYICVYFGMFSYPRVLLLSALQQRNWTETGFVYPILFWNALGVDHMETVKERTESLLLSDMHRSRLRHILIPRCKKKTKKTKNTLIRSRWRGRNFMMICFYSIILGLFMQDKCENTNLERQTLALSSRWLSCTAIRRRIRGAGSS